jgi:anthranilate phosphoribosyltransferase
VTDNSLDLTFGTRWLAPLVDGHDLSRSEATEALTSLLEGDVSDGLIASFLTALTMKGVTSPEMAGFVDAMMALATPLPIAANAIDIVGTGGDQLHTVNISSMAAVAVAGTGTTVAKHGNRAATGSVGAADVFEALGVNIRMTPDQVARCLEQGTLAFLFAPTFHPSLGRLAPVRRSLGFRTVFNNLGPLANPAHVSQAVIGVSQMSLLEPMAEVLLQRKMAHAVLVRGDEGLDELSLETTSRILDIKNGIMTSRICDAPAELGRRVSVAEIHGGNLATNLALFNEYLDGVHSSVSDIVNANAALALTMVGKAQNLREGFSMAEESVASGRAREALNLLRELSQS